jgi:hypothetical protein
VRSALNVSRIVTTSLITHKGIRKRDTTAVLQGVD